MTSGPYRRSLLVFAAVVVAGFAALGLGAAGAAASDHVDVQVAFATSGGVAGLGLIGVGLSLVVVQRRRWAAAQARHDLHRLVRATSDLLATVGSR